MKYLYLNEIRLFIRHFAEWGFLLIMFTIFFFTFGLKEVTFIGKTFLFPLPSRLSFAAEFFNHITTALVPSGVTLIVTNPLTAFIAQVKIALLMAFLLTLPFLLYKLIAYFFSALYTSEKKAILAVAIPSALLFALGSLFSYFVLIPPTFDILYSYTGLIDAAAFFAVNEFVNLALALMLAVGVMFLLPVGMTLLTVLGVISNNFWKEQWRYAVIFFLIISAIITPDGSGITMIFLSFPMALLYGIGLVLSDSFYKHGQSYILKRN